MIKIFILVIFFSFNLFSESFLMEKRERGSSLRSAKEDLGCQCEKLLEKTTEILESVAKVQNKLCKDIRNLIDGKKYKKQEIDRYKNNLEKVSKDFDSLNNQLKGIIDGGI